MYDSFFRPLVVVILLSLSFHVSAQITGISASKINSFQADVVGKGVLEFEPTFMSQSSSAFWNAEGVRNEEQSTTVSSGIQWRMCYGINDKMEIALATNPLLNGLNFDAKSTILSSDFIDLSAMAGFYFPFGNRSFDPDNPTSADLSSYAFGFIGTKAFNDRASIDINASYLNYWTQIEDETGPSVVLTADFGMLNKKESLLYIVSTYYQHNSFGLNGSDLFTISPGVSVESGNNYALIINTTHSIWGKNNSISHGISCAVTLFLD